MVTLPWTKNSGTNWMEWCVGLESRYGRFGEESFAAAGIKTQNCPARSSDTTVTT